MARNDVDRVIAELAEAQYGVVHRHQVVERGATSRILRRRVLNGALEEVGAGVLRTAGSRRCWEQDVMAAVLAAEPGAVASHWTAAALHRMPGVDRRGVEVVRLEDVRHGPTLGRVHETCWLPGWHTSRVEGIPVTSVARTIFDLAMAAHPKRVERLLDDALAARRISEDDLRRMLDELSRSGRSGIALMRRLVQERGPGYVATASQLEAIFVELLDAAGVAAPVRQLDAGGERWVGRVDFAYRAERLVVELDGRRHHTALLDRRSDARRDNELARAGWRVLRIRWDELTESPEQVVDLIRGALRRAA